MPALHDLAPLNNRYEQNLSLEYESWYRKFNKNVGEQKKMEWSLRPHHDFTDQLKNQAIEGGLNVNESIKKFNPAQVETELIIRY